VYSRRKVPTHRTSKQKKEPKIPAQLNPAVWDFRSVTAEELPWAATYECARSSTPVLELWAKWLPDMLKFDNAMHGRFSIDLKVKGQQPLTGWIKCPLLEQLQGIGQQFWALRRQA
jgi:hypothetical protein